MDRFSLDDSKKQLIYKNALEFIGAVRAGISWERFCIYAVRFSDAFIDMLNDTEDARKFMSSRDISMEYARKNARAVLARLHSNRDNDHYLTLALPRTTSEAQLNKRWKELMRIYHPDRNDAEDAAGYAKRINEAYSILKDPKKRMEYDRKRAQLSVSSYMTQRKNVARTKRSRWRLSIPPEVGRLVPKLIIASSMAASCVVLLIIFLKNRPGDYTYQASIVPAEKRLTTVETDKTQDPKEGKAKEDDNKMMIPATSSPLREELYKPESAQTEKASKEKGITTSAVKSFTPSGQQNAPRELPTTNIRADVTEKVTGEKKTTSAASNAILKESPDQNLKRDVTPPLSQESPSPGRKDPTNDPAESGPYVNSLKEGQGDTETEVFLFLAQYILAYEEGDYPRFTGLFSKSAVENNSVQYPEMMKFYKTNFEGSRYNYALKNVRFHKKDDMLIVSGNYSIRKITPDDKGIKTNGTIRWTLGKENGNLKIMRMDYDRK